MKSVREEIQMLSNIYCVLMQAVREHESDECMEAASEVLGYTGTWLSKLTPAELNLMQQQITSQLADKL